jgi:hypothetical protein
LLCPFPHNPRKSCRIIGEYESDITVDVKASYSRLTAFRQGIIVHYFLEYVPYPEREVRHPGHPFQFRYLIVGFAAAGICDHPFEIVTVLDIAA